MEAAFLKANAAESYIKQLVDTQATNGTAISESDEDKLRKKAFQRQAENALDSSRKMIGLAIKSIEAREHSLALKNTAKVEDAIASREVGLASIADSRSSSADAAFQDAVEDKKAYDQGLQAQVQTLSSMVDTARPVLENFDKVLEMPYLDNFNASIDIAPVMSLRKTDGKYKIQYVKSSIDDSGDNISLSWATFGELPDGATVTDRSKVFIFPHFGDLYIAIDGALWMLKHTNQNDTARLNQAVDNFPKMYADGWQQVTTSNALPNNAVSVFPYAQITEGGETAIMTVVVLDDSSRFYRLKANDFGETNEWTEISPKSAADRHSWAMATYQGGSVSAFVKPDGSAADGMADLWTFDLDLKGNTYSTTDKNDVEVKDILPVSPSTFTANETGLIVERSDGKLYQRIVQPNPNDPEGDAVASWKFWIDTDGVEFLGVASPGVQMNLNTLTRVLKQRYLTVQSAIAPALGKIVSYTTTQKFYLNNLLKTAKAYEADELDKDAALKAAKNDITHNKVWSSILSTAMEGSQKATVRMRDQLASINTQLKAQLKLLDTKLEGLQDTLKSQKKTLSKLEAAQWGSIAGIFAGLFLLIVGVASGLGPVAVAGGLLLLAAFVALIATSVSISDLNQKIAETNSQIHTTQSSIEALSAIQGTFDELETSYTNLVTFWGRSTGFAGNLEDFQSAMEAYGDFILTETSPIEASIETSGKLNVGALAYLDMLNAQGITSRSGARSLRDSTASGAVAPRRLRTAHTMLLAAQGIDSHIGPESAKLDINRDYLDHKFDSTLDHAHECLKRGDHGAYNVALGSLAAINFASASSDFYLLDHGEWVDLATVRSSMKFTPVRANALQLLSKPTNELSFPMSPEARATVLAVNASSETVARSDDDAFSHISQLANSLIAVCDGPLVWFKTVPALTDENRDKVARFVKQSQQAIGVANDRATRTHDVFTATQISLQKYQQHIKVAINTQNEQAETAHRTHDRNISSWDKSHRVDHLGWLGGLIGGAISESLHARARNRYTDEQDNILNSDLDKISTTIAMLKEKLKSGVTYNGSVLTWIEMSSQISVTLGHIHTLFGSLEGELLEISNLPEAQKIYQEALEIQWGNLKRNAEELLELIPSTVPTPRRAAQKPQLLDAATNDSHGIGNAALVGALAPHSSLSVALSKMSSNSASVDRDLKDILDLPFAADLVAYFEDNSTRRSIHSVAYELRSNCREVLAAQYPSILSLNSLGLLQKIRARSVADGTLRLEDFLTVTEQTLVPTTVGARRAFKNVKTMEESFSAIMATLNKSLDEIGKKLSSINDDFETAEQARKEKIISAVADAVAIMFAAGNLVASFRNSGSFFALSEALNTSVRLGLAAGTAAGSFKLILESMSPADVVMLIANLRAQDAELRATQEKFVRVQEIFQNVQHDMELMLELVEGMGDEIDALKTEFDLSKLGLSSKDAAEISAQWDSVFQATTVWLENTNSQGLILN